MTMAFHIANPDTDAKVRRLSAALGLGLVETVDLAVSEALEARDINITEPEPTGPGTAEELEEIIRRDMVTFKRLREEVQGRKSSVGYVPRMIKELWHNWHARTPYCERHRRTALPDRS